MLNAAICTIGDEILIGQIVDTNSSHIAKRLNSIGVKVARMSSISDEIQDIKHHLNSLLEHYDIVVVTGGLGPTKDDITKIALKELSQSESFVMNEGQLEIVKRILTERGIELTDINLNQASVPSNAEVILNRLGSAPCTIYRFPERIYRHKPTLYSIPGVPFEAIGLLSDIMDDIKTHHSIEDIAHKTITTFGIPESTLAKMIEQWEEGLPDKMHLAYLPNALNGVRLRLSIYGGDKSANHEKIEREFEKIKPILGNAVYGEGEETIASATAKLLTARHLTLSAAESCTGGRLASLLTSIPGASAYFLGSVTSYHNTVKENILGVSASTIAKSGAVSAECAEEMAAGVLKSLGSDIALSTTGIAGPDGGTPNKPTGTVWIGVAFKEAGSDKIITHSKKFNFSGNRMTNIERFSGNALNYLRETILSESLSSL